MGLTVLILVLAPVSGAHLNPVVTSADWLLGRRSRAGVRGSEIAPYVAAQVLGAILGAELANLMYGVPLDALSTKHRTGGDLLLGEVIATLGLILLVFALARTGRSALAAPAVGAYIGAAYWFTSSTSFANPAATVGRMFSDTFAGIAPAAVTGFVVAQLIGGAVSASPWSRGCIQEVTMSMSEVPQVVFACVRNGGRSVIARVLTEHYAQGTRGRALRRHPARRADPSRGGRASSSRSVWTPPASTRRC